MKLVIWLFFTLITTAVLYASGKSSSQSEIIGVRISQDGHEKEEVIRLETKELKDVRISTEGRRNRVVYNVISSYAIKDDASLLSDLPFLETRRDPDGSSHIQQAIPLPNSDFWVGLQFPSPVSTKFEQLGLNPRDHHMPVGRLKIVVFSKSKVIHSFTIEAPAEGPAPNVDSNRYLRFWRNDGWWRIDLDSGVVSPVAGRLFEAEPDVNGVVIPGTLYRLVFKVPSISNISETIGRRDYSFEASISSGISKVDALKMHVDAGGVFSFTARSREEFIAKDERKGDRRLSSTDRFVSVELSDGASQSSRYSSRKLIAYYLFCDNLPVRIILEIPTPFTRWSAIVSEFEQNLRLYREEPTGSGR